jgi:hypothetical protein
MAAAVLSIGTSYGQIPPAPVPTTPEDIVIRARPLTVETLVDRKVYHVSGDLQGTSGSAADVIGGIPSVEVDADGVVALRGDTSVLILIDGHPAAQLAGPLAGQGLQQMSAQDIERIEVITNPPAQYKSAGAAGVINIITRKSHNAGLSGTLNASQGNDHRFVVGASAAYKAGALGASVAAGLREDDRQRQILSDLVATDPGTQQTTVSHNVLDEHVRRRIPLAKAAVDYALNPDQSISASVNRGGRSGRRNFDQTAQSDSVAGVPSALSDRMSVGREWSDDLDERLVFDQKLGRPDEMISLTAHRTRFQELEHYDYANTYAVPRAAPSYDDLNLSEGQVSTELGADYVLPLPDGRKLKAGYEFRADDNRYGNAGDTIDPATGVLTPNVLITDDFQYLQQINAAYASCQASAGAWNWLGGLRVESTRNNARLLTNRTASSHAYAGAYPSLHLERALSESQTVSLGASRRISRPDPGALNPYVDRQDTQNLRAGNPNLLPQDTQSLELAYSAETGVSSYALTAYVRRNRNSVTDLTQVISADVVEITKANLPRNNSAGLEFTGNGRLGAHLRYVVSGNAFYSQIDGTALGASGLQSTAGLNAKVNLDYRPTAVDTGQLIVTRSDKRLTPQGYVGAINLVNLGYRRQFRPDLAAVATVSDLFNGQTLTRHVNSPGLSDTYERHVDGRILYVGLVYTFGSRKKSGAESFEFDQ